MLIITHLMLKYELTFRGKAKYVSKQANKMNKAVMK